MVFLPNGKEISFKYCNIKKCVWYLFLKSFTWTRLQLLSLDCMIILSVQKCCLQDIFSKFINEWYSIVSLVITIIGLSLILFHRIVKVLAKPLMDVAKTSLQTIYLSFDEFECSNYKCAKSTISRTPRP